MMGTFHVEDAGRRRHCRAYELEFVPLRSILMDCLRGGSNLLETILEGLGGICL